MAIPTVYAVGTASGSTGAPTPTYPAGTVANDVVVIFIESGNEPVPAMTDWFDVGVGVVNQPSGVVTALTVRWRRAAGALSGNITVPDSGNHTAAQAVGFRGCVTTVTPYEAAQIGLDNAAGTGVSIPGSTTTTVDTLVVAAFATGTDVISTAMVSGWANADLTSVTERCDFWTDQGTGALGGGGFGVATGGKAAAGAYGPTTATITTGNTKALMTFAMLSVAPAAPAAAAGFPRRGRAVYRR